MGSKNPFIKILFFIRHILLTFIFCLIVERILSLDNWKTISCNAVRRKQRIGKRKWTRVSQHFSFGYFIWIMEIVSLCARNTWHSDDISKFPSKLSYIVGSKIVDLLSKFSQKKIRELKAKVSRWIIFSNRGYGLTLYVWVNI